MNRIKDRRVALGMTQPQLAEILKKTDQRYDVAMVSRLECGVCLPPRNIQYALETALQVPLAELYDVDELLDMRCTDECIAAVEPSAEVVTLLHFLNYDKANGISRVELQVLMRQSDRQVRKIIEEARRDGFIICNEQDGSGYYLSDDPDEWEAQYRQDTSRALSILARRKALRAHLKAAGREV